MNSDARLGRAEEVEDVSSGLGHEGGFSPFSLPMKVAVANRI
jgi:hypothetical protein